MTDEQFSKLSEGEKNTCDLCRDYNLGDCKVCEILKRSDIIDNERMAATCEKY